jgi:hypothetical protein
VVYLYIDRLQQFFVRHQSKNIPRLQEENI